MRNCSIDRRLRTFDSIAFDLRLHLDRDDGGELRPSKPDRQSEAEDPGGEESDRRTTRGVTEPVEIYAAAVACPEVASRGAAGRGAPGRRQLRRLDEQRERDDPRGEQGAC